MRKSLLPLLVSCFVLTLAAAACNSAGPPPKKDVIAEALAAPGVLILDVRSPGEYAGGHAEGAVLVPVGDVEARIETIAPKKDVQIVVYCASGGRASKAASILQAKGYTKVLNAKTPAAVAKALGKPLVK